MSSLYSNCKDCKHGCANMFNSYCMSCTFGSKFEKKGEPVRHKGGYGYKASTVMFDEFVDRQINEFMKNLMSCGEVDEMKNMKIDKVIFNDPATIVYWKDGTKTVVKAKDESFDPEKGLAMAIAKKALGNEGNYFEIFKKYLPKEEKKEEKKAASSTDDVSCNPGKSRCTGNCQSCCPVRTGSKKNTGKGCKTCKSYQDKFGK